MINLRHIYLQFDKKIILNDLSLEINKGSIYGLVGPNGAGKSTILRLICGIYRPDKGQVSVEDVSTYNNPKILEKIFFVADDPYFLPNANLNDMYQFYKIFYPNFDDETYFELLKQFPIDPKAKISTFSKGMKRQAIVILAISAKTDYLLLDEAFDGLDPVMRHKLKKLLSLEVLNRNLTVIISSHNLRELEDICDCMSLISNGKITMNGSISEHKEHTHKIQLALKDFDLKLLDKFEIIHQENVGVIYTLIIKGNLEEIKEIILKQDPLIFEILPITLEEIFVYEMEADGYGK